MALNIQLPFTRKGTESGVNTTFGLTPLGKTKAEQFSMQGPRFDVLAVLDEGGPCSISEIAEETKMSTNKIKQIIKQLVVSNYVRKVGNEDS